MFVQSGRTLQSAGSEASQVCVFSFRPVSFLRPQVDPEMLFRSHGLESKTLEIYLVLCTAEAKLALKSQGRVLSTFSSLFHRQRSIFPWPPPPKVQGKYCQATVSVHLSPKGSSPAVVNAARPKTHLSGSWGPLWPRVGLEMPSKCQGLKLDPQEPTWCSIPL